jgi:hypothetical protein
VAEEGGVYDANDPEAIEAQRRQAEVRERDDDETIRIWMNHAKGRDFLYRFVFETAKTQTEFIAANVDGSTDVHRTFASMGERNMGGWWLARMQRHPELYMKMLQEQETERQLRDTRLRKQNENQEEHDGRSPSED